MAKAIFGEASPEEVAVLQKLLQDQPELQQQYDLLTRTLKSPSKLSAEHPSPDTQSKIQHIIRKASQQEKKNRKSVVFQIKKHIPLLAASIILLIVAGWLLISRKGDVVTMPNELHPAFVTQNGARQQAVLPDGSKVWLNGGSKLSYNNDFKGATREVTLEGEAFFDIVKNTRRPFIVHANNINIKVLGTAFNVKAYAEDENVETTLYRGLVNISKNHDKNFQPIMLYPNQKIRVPNEILHHEADDDTQVPANAAIEASIVIQQIDSVKLEPQRIETAWMYNRLEFRGDSFTSLARKLERWFNVTIAFGDEEVKKLSFTGSFEKETIEQALLALTTANAFNYKINGNEILISSSK